MKGAIAAMMVVTAALRDYDRVRVRLGIVGDEESEEGEDRGCDRLVASGFIGDFAITGEPTDLHIGVEAKGVLALRLEVGVRRPMAPPLAGRQRRPERDRRFPEYRVATVRETEFGVVRPPVDKSGRIWGGDALNKVPDRCVIDVDIRYLPGQDPDALLEEIQAMPGVTAAPLLVRPPATVDRDSPFVLGLREAAATHGDGEPMSVGRDGASDAVSFLRVGVPAVEFGPVGAGHHGPAEWVSISSLEGYRQALESFLRAIPERLGE